MDLGEVDTIAEQTVDKGNGTSIRVVTIVDSNDFNSVELVSEIPVTVHNSTVLKEVVAAHAEIVMVRNLGNLSTDVVGKSTGVGSTELVHDNANNKVADGVVTRIFVEVRG